MPVELQDNELKVIGEAIAYFLDMRLKAKRSTKEQKLRDARAFLVLDRIRVALDAQTKAALLEVAAHLSKTEGEV